MHGYQHDDDTHYYPQKLPLKEVRGVSIDAGSYKGACAIDHHEADTKQGQDDDQQPGVKLPCNTRQAHVRLQGGQFLLLFLADNLHRCCFPGRFP